MENLAVTGQTMHLEDVGETNYAGRNMECEENNNFKDTMEAETAENSTEQEGTQLGIIM